MSLKQSTLIKGAPWLLTAFLFIVWELICVGFSIPDFLLPAIIDLRLHLLADGSGAPIDPVQVENDTVAELGLPAAWDLIMRVTHNVHCFAGGYAAGLYSYLWADVMAADAVERFERAPGGLYDAPTARAWIDSVLSV